MMADYRHKGIRILILQGPMSLCAYLGVPGKHPIANQDYDEIDIPCHGGLTFGQSGEKGTPWPEGFFWYGWDYAHDGRLWTLAKVKAEAEEAVPFLKKLMKVAEKKKKAKKGVQK